MTRAVVVNLSDTHAGCKFGLMPPDVVLHDEDENGNLIPWVPTQTATQVFLWHNVYLPAVRRAFEIANGDPLYVNHNGDETHGNKYPSELVSTRMADQITVAVANMEPWYEYPNLVNVMYETGTGAHNFLEASSTILVVKQLNAIHGKTELCAHGLIEYNGCTVDVAHHGPHPGSRSWLTGNVARFYLRDLMKTEREAGRTPPRMVWRAHYHTPVHEYLENGQDVSELYITPALCGLGEHATQATRSTPCSTWGINIFEIVDGEVVKCHKLHTTVDLRTRRVF